MITTLFLNLNTHLHGCLNFSENIDDGKFYVLSSLNFSESGLKVKQILESVYKDGITGLESVKVEGDRITGIFLDYVSPALTRRFKFEITPDNVLYQIENPEDDAQFSEYLEFVKAKTPRVGETTKADKTGRVRQCTEGKTIACGARCQSPDRPCKQRLDPQLKSVHQEIVDAFKQVVAESPAKAIPKNAKDAKRAEAIAPETQTPVKVTKTTSKAKKVAKVIEDSQDTETKVITKKKAKTKPKVEKELPPEKSSEPSTKGKPTITNQDDFDDVFLSVYDRLNRENNYNGLVPIYKIRRELGESVSRDQFSRFALNLQERDLLGFQGGSVEDSESSKIEDSLQTGLDGIRTYAKLRELSPEQLRDRVASSKDKVDSLLKDREPLSPLGSAKYLSQGDKIKDQKEFESVVEEAVKRLNYEFNYNGITPISKVRELLKDRVSRSDFDKMLGEMNGNNDDLLLQSDSKSNDTKDSYITPLGDKKDFIGFDSIPRNQSPEDYEKSIAKFKRRTGSSQQASSSVEAKTRKIETKTPSQIIKVKRSSEQTERSQKATKTSKDETVVKKSENNNPISRQNSSELQSIRESMSEKFGEDLVNSSEESVRRILKDSSVFIRTSSDVISSILKDGFKNTYQLNPKVDEFSYEYFRQQDEKKFFNLNDQSKPDDYPIYGYLSENVDQNGLAKVNHYGDVAVKLKNSIKDRTTSSLGDSLSGIYPSRHDQFNIASLMTEDQRSGTSYDDLTKQQMQEISKSKNLDDIYNAVKQPYIESQIHGGVSPEDIEEIILPKNINLSNESLDRVKKLGIRVSYQ